MSELVEHMKAKKLTERLAEKFGIDPDNMMKSLRATAFNAPNISNEQLVALCVVSEQYGLNPWLKEIYAYPAKGGGIIPVVGVDGWARIINSNPAFDGMDFDQTDESCTCTIHRKDRSHPVRVTEWMSECRKEGIGPWMTHPKRMLRHKAMIQCARIAFGFAGIYDPDEAERVVEGEVIREESKRRSTSTAQVVVDEQQTQVDEEKLQEYLAAIRASVACEDSAGIIELYAEMDHDIELVSWTKLDSKSRTWIRKVRDEAAKVVEEAK
jgi:phage recombination protein Bet